MKIIKSRLAKLIGTFFALLLFTSLALCQSGPPPPPPDPFLDNYYFNTPGWLSESGYAPIAASSNLVSVQEGSRNALLLDTADALPAFLNYNIIESDGSTNLVFDAGAIRCAFICDWATADTNQFGFGPGDLAGDPAYLLAAGDFSSNSPQGLWSIYFDAGGSNIYFGGVSNSESTVYVSAPISWPSNSIHEIGLVYSTNTMMFIDGQIAATGGPVTIVPATNVWTNGFFVGSDSLGYEQARGIFWYLEFCDSNFFDPDWSDICNDSFFTNSWLHLSNEFAALQASPGGFGPDGGGGFNMPPTPTNSINTNYAAYGNFGLLITNVGGAAQVNLINAARGLTYVIVTNAHVEPMTSTNWQPWVTLVGSNTVMSVTNFMMGSNTLFFNAILVWETGTNGLPDWWQMEYFGTLNVDPYADPDNDGLCNLDEYILGTNPTNANSLTPLHTDAQALFLAYTNYDAHCTYGLIVTNGTNANIVLVTMTNTAVGTNYQIYTHDHSDTNSTWIVETSFPGTNNATTVAITLNGRTLDYIGGYGEDSDGDGLPDGYEVLATLTDPYLPDTGLTGVQDGYKDPDGDGYSNLQEYYNGTNPHHFDTPAGPQGLVADLTDGGDSLTFSWQPASGPVLGYVVSIYEDGTLTPIATNTAKQLNYVLSDPAQYAGYNTPGYGLPFTVTAIFSNGPSLTNGGGLLLRPGVAEIALVNGPGGKIYMLSSGAASNVLGYTNFYFAQYAWFYPEFEQYFQTDGNYYPANSPETDTNAYIPASQFTNGVAVLTDAQAPPYLLTDLETPPYQYGGYAQLPGGAYCAVFPTFQAAYPAVPFIDGTAQMKENIRFLLRVASSSSFGCTYAPYSFAYPSDHVYSTYYYDINPGSPEFGEFSDVSMDHFATFEDNYFFANFVFDANYISMSGNLETGFDPSYGSGYSPYTNTPRFEFPTYNYVLSSNQAAIPGILSSSSTPWVGYFSGGIISDFGAYYSGSSLDMSNYVNLYGLPYSNLVLTVSNGTQATLSPGSSVSGWNSGSFYSGTVEPELITVEYYFARPGIDPLPGYRDGSFAVTNLTPMMIGSVGTPMLIAGYAKQEVLNGYNTVFAYLGQYFTNAFLMDNGIATTNPAGILSEYGQFFPTVPGQVALTTMPDPDQTNLQGTNVVDIIRLSLDVNHDGTMDETYTGPDNTSYAAPFVFWINNDFDRWTIGLLDGSVPYEDDLESDYNVGDEYVVEPDCNYTNFFGERAIPCPRDLEDYARLWVSGVSNTLSGLPEGSTVTLSWAGLGNSPTIDLFQAADSDGGTGYLTDLTIASNQINTTLCRYVGRLGPGGSIQLNTSSFSNGWAGDHYIWCGVLSGMDQLNLTITDGGGKVLAQSYQFLQIQDIKQMYERWTVGDNDDNNPMPLVVPMTNAALVNDGQPQFQYPYAATYDTNETYILYVTGWNMPTWLKDRWAETAYKRLYWQGYQGRFGLFRWPCYNLSANTAGYDTSEWQSWKTGQPLENFLAKLDGMYPGNVYVFAHSQGNPAMGEALRLATNQIVNTYVATQAAVSARAYDNTLASNATNYYSLKTPDSQGNYYSNGAPSYFSGSIGAGTYVNFYNPQDYALMGDSLNPFAFHPGWLIDQSLKPDEGYTYSSPTTGNPSGYDYTFPSGLTYATRNLLFTNDTYQIFAMCAQSYSLALGAQVGVGGAFKTNAQVNLNASFNFGNEHIQHDEEFTFDNMTTAPYWQQLLLSFGLKN